MTAARTDTTRRCPEVLEATYFRRLFEDAGLAVCTCDPDGRLVAWNTLAEMLFCEQGLTPGALNVECILPERDRPTFRDRLAEVVRTRESTEFRTRLERPCGVREYALWLTPVRDDRGHLEHVTLWFHDITARIQLRRSIRSRERLTTLGALSGSIVHHYSNLLCSIATSVEYALNMNTLSATRRALTRAMEALQRATELTHQLLAFAQADRRADDMADLTETVLYFFDQQEPALQKRGIELDLQWQRVPSLPMPRGPVLSMLEHLVRNAAEAMPHGGTLRVRLGMDSRGRVSLCVTDTGPGIPPEHLDRIFEPFFTTKQGPGDARRQVGMGLAVVYGLVNEMHGSITARNEPSGGACFEVVFPLPDDAAPADTG